MCNLKLHASILKSRVVTCYTTANILRPPLQSHSLDSVNLALFLPPLLI